MLNKNCPGNESLTIALSNHEPHSYLAVDLYPITSDSCRLRTNIFPGEILLTYQTVP